MLKSQSSSGPRRSASGASSGDLSPGEVIAGKYRLERAVGRGGMGTVWAARNEQLGMLVALKFIEVEGGTDLTDARARFEREAKAAAQIRSPHVAQVFEHGLDGDRPYIAMELLDGEDLGDRLRREGRLTLSAAARILTQSAKALRRAHEAGIIHRDLKPGNIFLARFDDDEMVKILDFGVAKVRTEGAIDAPLATQTGIVFGSPTYMSPEQARGVRSIDHRSDLWSMAVIVFRAITGVKPFQAASIGDLVVKLCIDPLPVATSFAPDLPPEVDRFFARAFARDPDRRFATAPEMAAAFEAVAAGASAPSQRAPAPSVPSLFVARVPAEQLPPAPPLAPAPPAASPAPVPGSGPHVAFAPGTLTPPAGAGVDESSSTSRVVAPPPYRAPDAQVARAAPAFPELPPPIAGARTNSPAAPPLTHRPEESPALAPPPWSPEPALGEAAPAMASAGPRPLAVLAVLAAAALTLMVAVLAFVSRGRGGHVGASPPSASPLASSAILAPVAPSSAVAPPPPISAVAAPPPSAEVPAASVSADASASPAASAEPAVAPTSTADPVPDSSAAPRARNKPGKRRPNFGY